MILELVDIKNPVLRKKAKPVEALDKKTEKLITDMWETLEVQEDPEGVGLAAPQIGKSLRIFLMNNEGTKRTVINPKVLKVAKRKINKKTKKSNKNDILEGCLSLQHYYGPITRNSSITIQYMNEKWEQIEEKFEGFLAQIVEHEIDHLNGILFIDRIIEQNSPLYKFHGDEFEEVDLI